MEQHEGALGELVQRPEQRGPGLSHLPLYRYVHLLAGERRLRRIIGVRRGRRGGAGSHVRVLELLLLVLWPAALEISPASVGFCLPFLVLGPLPFYNCFCPPNTYKIHHAVLWNVPSLFYFFFNFLRTLSCFSWRNQQKHSYIIFSPFLNSLFNRHCVKKRIIYMIIWLLD